MNDQTRIRCPKCGTAQTGVVDSRENADHTVVRRRRKCPVCGEKFTTHERYSPETFKEN